MGYDLVSIYNSTDYNASGTVSYVSIFCSDDDYDATSDTSWSASSRGWCLVEQITAGLNTPDGDIQATPYSSSGTSYSEFAIIKTGINSFEVTRRVTGQEDEKPADYAEPTNQQK